MFSFYLLLVFLSTSLAALEKNVLMTEVFEIIIDPPMFNWTYEGIADQYVYYPSLLDYPDLPSWIHYTYSGRHHAGFLYGVPPKTSNTKVPLEIIGLNRKDYTTKRETLNIHITEKRNPAKHEIHMKIDNLNVEDMFDVQTMDNLKNVMKNQLWKESQNDLYLTFLASAVDLGARKPLNPEEGEGVVLRLGSTAPLSTELIELQDEVRPLWKVPSCPRNFKRTSVERYFRDAGFALDWCSFRLSDSNAGRSDSATPPEPPSFLKDVRLEEVWRSYRKDEVPERSYKEEFLLSLLVPLLIMIILILLVSLILCFHHEGIKDEASEDFFENIFHICTDYWRSKQLKEVPQDEKNQYATIHKATHTLRSLSNNRDLTAVSPECVLLSRSHTNSPTSTISRGVHCRPSPPPYVRPKFKPNNL